MSKRRRAVIIVDHEFIKCEEAFRAMHEKYNFIISSEERLLQIGNVTAYHVYGEKCQEVHNGMYAPTFELVRDDDAELVLKQCSGIIDPVNLKDAQTALDELESNEKKLHQIMKDISIQDEILRQLEADILEEKKRACNLGLRSHHDKEEF